MREYCINMSLSNITEVIKSSILSYCNSSCVNIENKEYIKVLASESEIVEVFININNNLIKFLEFYNDKIEVCNKENKFVIAYDTILNLYSNNKIYEILLNKYLKFKEELKDIKENIID